MAGVYADCCHETESTHVARKAFSLAWLEITRIGKLGIVFEAHTQDARYFEYLMHAYVNQHEVAERAFNHPCVQLCVHVGVFTYVWYSS